MAKLLSSRLSSALSFCAANGLFGTCFLTLGSSTLCRGTQWMQQHKMQQFKSFPWCHLPLACSSASQLSPAFLRFLSPPSSFTTKQSWTQLGGTRAAPLWGHIGGLGHLFGDPPSPVSTKPNHPPWPWDTTTPTTSGAGRGKNGFKAHILQIQSKNASKVPFRCLVGDNQKHLWGLCGQF